MLLNSCLLLGLLQHAAAQIVPNNQLPLGSSFGRPGQDATYDYVVIGAGTSGSAIATRLAEDGRYSVAVIEAGGFAELENSNHSNIPGYAFDSAGPTLEGVNPLIDWQFMTTPQSGAGNRSYHYARGKTLGGSSARNILVFQRPTVGTLQRWADDVGDQSWQWSSTFKYYKKSSHLQPPNIGIRGANSTPIYKADDFGDGPVQAGFPNYVGGLVSWIEKALQELKVYQQPGGVNNGALLGYGYTTLSLDGKTQSRSWGQTSYLNLALRKTLLTIYTHTFARKIIFTNKTATAVQVESDGVQYKISAKREIILSAGAFQSPQLLMVSGVGPAEQLKKLNIPVIADSPGVGQNLQDNPLFGISYPLNVETSSSYLTNPARLVGAIQAYNNNRTGFLTTSGADILSYFKADETPNSTLSTRAKNDLASFPADWPDIQIASLSTYFGAQGITPQPDLKNYGGFVGTITAVMSRGSVTINSSSMADPPIIDPAWITHPTDEEVVVATIKKMRQIAATDAMRQIILGPETFPGENVTSDADILAAVKGQSATFYHAAATCKMGLRNDTMAVVDSKARVIGVDGLRVVDLSAVPFLPPGQPQATAYMLGEKIADEILYADH